MKQYGISFADLKMQIFSEDNLISRNENMNRIIDLINRISRTNANVVLTGETGVGKSMVANIIHQNSTRSDKPFVRIDCGTIPVNLIESELFGYEPGAFTGAGAKGKIGKIEVANGSTLFLDEISELSLEMQVRLLSAIQQKKIMRVGSIAPIDVDFRLITASNKDLKKEVEKGTFREDLYYRLNVIPIHLPPLRERVEDILPLTLNFLEKFNRLYDKKVVILREVIAIFEEEEWQGNIRQLENLVERLVILSSDGIITPGDLFYGMDNCNTFSMGKPAKKSSNLKSAIEAYEEFLIRRSYEKNKTSIAVGNDLGISQTTAARKLRKYIPEYCE
jgi:transcriptional regulator with PAS, ATPase and Fis domain